MKKYLSIILVLLLCPIMNVRALDSFEFIASGSPESKKTVNGSSLLAGDNVKGSNQVNGVAMLFGNNITFDGESEYGLMGGNVLKISGTIKNDGLFLGNQLTFDSTFNIDRDLFVFGNEVTIDGNCKRNVTIYASKVTINGIVNGDVVINASEIILKDSTVEGTLKYNEDAKIDSTSHITNVEKTEALNTNNVTVINKFTTKLLRMAEALVVFVALVLIVPGLFKRIDEQNKNIKVCW